MRVSGAAQVEPQATLDAWYAWTLWPLARVVLPSGQSVEGRIQTPALAIVSDAWHEMVPPSAPVALSVQVSVPPVPDLKLGTEPVVGTGPEYRFTGPTHERMALTPSVLHESALNWEVATVAGDHEIWQSGHAFTEQLWY